MSGPKDNPGNRGSAESGKKNKSPMEEALNFLKHRMRTVSEMRERLKDRGYDPEEIKDTIQELKQLRYLDDVEYAQIFAGRSLEKGRGRLRIVRELEERGIDRETAENAVDDVSYEKGIDPFTAALQVARLEMEKLNYGRPQAGADSTEDQEEENRKIQNIGRKLARLGYSNSDVFKVMDRLRRDEQ